MSSHIIQETTINYTTFLEDQAYWTNFKTCPSVLIRRVLEYIYIYIYIYIERERERERERVKEFRDMLGVTKFQQILRRVEYVDQF